MIRKVFLSHSSENKEFIDSVYDKLPSIAVYDKYSFHTGDEFIQVINSFLAETALFVLFASKESLKAPWVKYEIDQATLLKINGKINQMICIIIDDSKIEEIPQYLRSCNICKSNNPKDVAATIQGILNKINESSFIYLGRNSDADEVEKKLFPLYSEETPYIFNLYGIPGIGKRTFFKNSIMALGKHKFFKPILIPVEDGEKVFSLSAKILSYLKPYSCIEEFYDYTKKLKLLSDEDIIDELLHYIPTILKQQSLICFYDFDYILDDSGYVKESFSNLFDKICIPQLLFVAISRRKVHWSLGARKNFFRLEGLNEEAMQRIIMACMQARSLALSRTQIKDIAECASGHPGIAQKIVEMIQEYGFDTIMDSKEKIKVFSTSIFEQHINSYLQSDHAKKIMGILNWFSPIPFCVLKKVFPSINCGDEIMSLIDKCIVEIEPETTLISVSQPLVYTISQHVSQPSTSEMKKIASAIMEYYKEKSSDDFNVPLALAMARIMGIIDYLIPGDKETHRIALAFDADFVKKVKQYYYDDMYDRAISLALKVLNSGNQNQSVLNMLIKSYIEINKFEEAMRVIEESDSNNWLSPKNICMLKGLYFEKTNRTDEAIEEYKNAQLISPNDIHANMELAKCYIARHDYNAASEIIERFKDNPALKSKNKLLDCAIKVLTRTGNFADAQQMLEDRALLRKDKYYYIRLSDWHHAQGNIESAIEAAKMADGERYFPKYMQLASLLFEKHDCDGFKKNLDYIESTFPFKRNNEILYLKSEYLILQGNYKLAYKIIANCSTIPTIVRDQISYLCFVNLEGQVSIKYSRRLEYKSKRLLLEADYKDRLPLLQSLYHDAL